MMGLMLLLLGTDFSELYHAAREEVFGKYPNDFFPTSSVPRG